MNFIERLYSYFLPVFGGAAGGVSAPEFNMMQLHLQRYIDVFICAVIGAVTGYLIKILLDKIFKKNAKRS